MQFHEVYTLIQFRLFYIVHFIRDVSMTIFAYTTSMFEIGGVDGRVNDSLQNATDLLVDYNRVS